MAVLGVLHPESGKPEALGDQQRARARGNGLHDVPEWLQLVTEGPTEGTFSSTDDTRAVLVIRPPAIPPLTHASARLSSYMPNEKHNLFTHFAKDATARHASAQKSQERIAKEIPKVERFEFLMRKIFRYCYCELQNSQ